MSKGEKVIKVTNPYNAEELANQIHLQKRNAWDLMDDIPWHLAVDESKYLLPIDDEALAFPGASAEQRLALSQWMGLVVNTTISEMEDALPKLKFTGWEKVLRNYPANPELWEVGELFFEEEAKHSRAFTKYLELFCLSHGIEKAELDTLLPKAFGSFFQKSISFNADTGGHAFWWVVASVEEVSIRIFQQLLRVRKEVDPLFYQLHKRHLEEESRHANYAYLMLNLIKHQPMTLRGLLHRKTNFLIAQIVGGPWVMAELMKFFNVKKLKNKHPFFEVLHSCIPLYEKLSMQQKVSRVFVGAPYISWLMNPTWKENQNFYAKELSVIQCPFPKLNETELHVEQKVETKEKDDKAS